MKLPSGCADAAAGASSAAATASEEDETLHRSSLLATGAHSTEKCGLSARARPNQLACCGPVAEAALDHPAVEELERVARPEPQRAPGVAQRLAAAAVSLERPREDVVAVDRRPLPLRAARERERGRQADAVVDVEERGLEVGLDAVGDEQPLDDADQRVLLARLGRSAVRA